ncbi:MAG: FAD-binding oxidoreductase [Polyangiaceae bacterium]
MRHVGEMEVSKRIPTARTSAPRAKALTSWGRMTAVGREVSHERLEEATHGAALARGMARSYGDASLPAAPVDRLASTLMANRVLGFCNETGKLRAESGLTLADLNRLFLPRGWFTPVSPGTQFVTLGGMVASDVHGKNHHRDGCFGAHLTALRVRLGDGDIVDCSPEEHSDLFYGCIGGMGLLGHILEVEFSLRAIPSGWIRAETRRVDHLADFLSALAEGASRWPYTMGWIDCLSGQARLGRGVLIAGEWAGTAPGTGERARRPVRFPFDLPAGVLNRYTARAFNAAFFRSHPAGVSQNRSSPEPFFYPLDRVLDWNRAYGKRGFTQYQCVLPRAAGPEAVHEFMRRMVETQSSSPLCVIKDCGPEGKGVLSFPLEGTSIAADMQITAETKRIVQQLNDFVIAVGGRIYLTKDQFTTRQAFAAMEPRLGAFNALRERWDPNRRLRSALSQRLLEY